MTAGLKIKWTVLVLDMQRATCLDRDPLMFAWMMPEWILCELRALRRRRFYQYDETNVIARMNHVLMVVLA